MLRQVVTNQAGQQIKSRQEEVDTSRIRKFLRMNPPSFMVSITTENPENFVEELKKVFYVMHVADAKRVELTAYQLKTVARTWFDQWNEGRDEDAPYLRKEYGSKKAKTGNESGHQKGVINRPQFQKQKGLAPSCASVPAPRNKDEHHGQNSQNFRARPTQSQGSVAQGGSSAPAYAKCGVTHPSKCCDG
nr:uncharacterized protein LOC101263910 [Solanum lycopersicum]